MSFASIANPSNDAGEVIAGDTTILGKGSGYEGSPSLPSSY